MANDPAFTRCPGSLSTRLTFCQPKEHVQYDQGETEYLSDKRSCINIYRYLKNVNNPCHHGHFYEANLHPIFVKNRDNQTLFLEQHL